MPNALNKDWLQNYYTVQEFSYKERIAFSASHWDTNREIKNNPKLAKFNPIVPGVYLGKLPTVGKSAMVQTILDQIPKLAAVFSCLLPPELHGNGLPNKVPTQHPADWKNLGVDHHLLLMRDFKGHEIDVEDLYHTVKVMRSYVEKGENIYVHCKAGKGRSALLVAAYIAIYGIEGNGNNTLSAEEIHEHVCSKRKQVHLKEESIDKLKELMKHHEKQKKNSSIDNNNNNQNIINTVDNIKNVDKDNTNQNYTKNDKQGQFSLNDIQHYLNSRDGKIAVAQLSAFKNFHFYADDYQDGRKDIIQNFFDKIYHAENEISWVYDVFTKKSGPILQLLAYKPGITLFGVNPGVLLGIHTGNPEQRDKLVDDLKEGITSLLAKKFGCSDVEMEIFLESQIHKLPTHKVFKEPCIKPCIKANMNS